MEWNNFKQKLLDCGYSIPSIKKIKSGEQLPTVSKLFELEKIGISIDAWRPFVAKYNYRNTTKSKTCAQELPSVTGCDDGN
ncbi:MAG: hypothetical protein LBD84_07605, partial [Campylobacteraceae bacterium]|nr:hypothetical protein [Campylobacteraceae bacterium]